MSRRRNLARPQFAVAEVDRVLDTGAVVCRMIALVLQDAMLTRLPERQPASGRPLLTCAEDISQTGTGPGSQVMAGLRGLETCQT
jgi:hypothetical protein